MKTIFDYFNEEWKACEEGVKLLDEAWKIAESGDETAIKSFTKMITKKAVKDVFSWVISTKWPDEFICEIKQLIEEAIIGGYSKEDYSSADPCDTAFIFDASDSTAKLPEGYWNNTGEDIKMKEEFESIYYDAFVELTHLGIVMYVNPASHNWISIYFENCRNRTWDSCPEGWEYTIYRDSIVEMLEEMFDVSVSVSGDDEEDVIISFEATDAWKIFKE